MFDIRSIPSGTRQTLAFVHDVITVPLALTIAYLIRFQNELFSGQIDDLVGTTLAALPIAIIAFWAFGLYAGVWRFASLKDLTAIVKASTVIAVSLVTIDFFTRGEFLIPRSVVAIYWFVQMPLLGGSRIAYRLYRDGRAQRSSDLRPVARAPVLIAGSGQHADVIIRSIEFGMTEPLRPVGILSTQREHFGQKIRGVPALGTLEDLERATEKLRDRGIIVQRLLVSSEALGATDRIEAAIAMANRLGIAVERPTRLPVAGEPAVRNLQFTPVNIEDLIGRPPRDLDYRVIRRMTTGRRVVVTGGGGSIGSELCRQLAQLGCGHLMIVEHSEFALYQVTREMRSVAPDMPLSVRVGSVRDRARIVQLFNEFQPDLVFHAAALKHVDLLERNIGEAVRTNVIGTMNVADAARAVDAMAMILISTDKAVRPVSVMGATKRAAELYCETRDALAIAETRGVNDKRSPTRFMAVRFGNVFGSSGSVVPLFKEQIERGGPVTVTHPDMTRYFMTIREAASLVLMASANQLADGSGSSVFVLDMGEPVRVMDLAERMIRLTGSEPGDDIAIEIIGLREGERLEEYLFDDAEGLVDTGIDGVKVAEVRAIDPETVLDAFDRLVTAVNEGADNETIRLLQGLVPEYAP